MKNEAISGNRKKRIKSVVLRIIVGISIFLGIISILVIGAIVYLFKDFTRYEIVDSVSNDEFKVVCESYNSGVWGPWGIDIYITEPEPAWYELSSKNEILSLSKLYLDATLKLDKDNTLLINAWGTIFLANLAHLRSDTYYFHRDLGLDYYNPYLVDTNQTKSMTFLVAKGGDNTINLEIKNFTEAVRYTKTEVVLLNADSVDVSFDSPSVLELEIKWSNSLSTLKYLLDLSEF